MGGGSVHFTANYWRFHESDFHERSLFGEVSGADLTDCPIAYADLEPYYIETDDVGRATGAIYFDRNRREVFQRAKAVFVCANGAETPKLLLMSKSKRFPAGLAAFALHGLPPDAPRWGGAVSTRRRLKPRPPAP